MNKKCKYSKNCGGCTLLDVPYSRQLADKEEYIKKLLRKYGEVSPIIGMDNPYNYRNKIHATYANAGKGNIISGIYREGTHDVVSVDSCLIENEVGRQIAKTIAELLPSFKLKAYNEDKHFGFLRHVLIRTGYESGQIMVVLVAGTNVFPSKKNFVNALLKKHPNITTIVFNINDRNTSMVLGNREEVLYGKGYIEDKLCGKTFRISPKSFYQINPVQTEKLYNKALEYAALTGKETVIDAYCGTGTIGIVASDKAKKVIGAELNKDAVSDARTNAKLNNCKNISFVCADAGEFMVNMASKGEKADVVIMDPPRAGSTKQFMDALVKLSPERVVYISCNPETLARDLYYITKKGYEVTKAVPVEMFCFTEHCESVVLLEKM